MYIFLCLGLCWIYLQERKREKVVLSLCVYFASPTNTNEYGVICLDYALFFICLKYIFVLFYITCMKPIHKLFKSKNYVEERDIINLEEVRDNEITSIREEKEDAKSFLIITGDVLINWLGLQERLRKFYKLGKEEISLLMNDVEDMCYGKVSEGLVYNDFKRVLMRDLYDELSINLNEVLLSFLEEVERHASILLVTNLKKHSDVFLPAFRFIDKVFKPWEYNKGIVDKGFMDVLYGYVKYYRVYSPTTLVLSSNFGFIKSLYRRFSIQSFLKVKPYYYDYYGKYNNIKISLGEAISLEDIKYMIKKDKVKQFIVDK